MSELKYIIDEAIEQLEDSGTFIIDSDSKAEWAIKKIQIERLECARMESVCKTMIMDYERQIQKSKEQLDTNTSFLLFHLQRYMNTVKPKESKTALSYKLPCDLLGFWFGDDFLELGHVGKISTKTIFGETTFSNFTLVYFFSRQISHCSCSDIIPFPLIFIWIVPDQVN